MVGTRRRAGAIGADGADGADRKGGTSGITGGRVSTGGDLRDGPQRFGIVWELGAAASGGGARGTACAVGPAVDGAADGIAELPGSESRAADCWV